MVRSATVEAEHLEFPVNARRTPGRILARHLEDQLLELFRDRRSPDLLGFRFEPPVPPERTTMPLHHGFWLHHQERSLPPRPHLPDCDPKPPIHPGQPRPSILSFQDGDLLPKDEVLQHQTATAAKEAKHDSEGESKEAEHERGYSRRMG